MLSDLMVGVAHVLMGQAGGIEMPVSDVPATARSVTSVGPGPAGCYDILILDAGFKQSLASVRSLGRLGLRVAVGDCRSERPVPAFRSRYSSCNVLLPSYAADPAGFVSAIASFVEEHPTRVILPTGDEAISTLRPHRERFAELGSKLALPSTSALEIAMDKDQTLEVARKLGIERPRTFRIDDLSDVPGVLAELMFPIVLKPTLPWSGHSAHRVQPMAAINRDEMYKVAKEMLAAGSSVLAQEWASGRREGVSLFIADGEVMAACAHAAYRTQPPLGGYSVMRESIPLLPDIYGPAVQLAQAIGLEGPCEVEFRRDAGGRPLLMEINPRLAGTIENAVHSGVDFPRLIWQWATGLPIDRVTGYRVGVRTHWLHGELGWLQETLRRTGRPDSVTRGRALWTIAAAVVRIRHYDCLDPRDLGPSVTELRNTAASVFKSMTKRTPAP